MAEELRLLMEIKGDLGETKGIVSQMREEAIEHRDEDRASFGEVKARIGRIEQQQAEAIGAAQHRARGELRQAGIIAALISGAVTAFGNLLPHWWTR